MLRLNFGNPRTGGKGKLVLVKLENLTTNHLEFALAI